MLFPLVSAIAQPRDVDCSDFSSQAQAQEELQRDPTDPFTLDPDGDGIACEGFIPSPSRITSYMIICLALAAIISFALLIRRKRRTSDASGQDLERRVANLSSNLQAAARVIGEIEKEIQARQKLVDRLKHDAEQSEALAQLHSDEVEAVAQALRGQLSGLERRSFRSNFVLSLTFFAIGVITSILVNVFVP